VSDFEDDDLELDESFEPASAQVTDVETILHRVADVVSNARPMPLSASVMINRDEVLELVEEALSRLPEELRSARWLLREREEFLAKVQREGDDILDAARVRAERMVQRTEVVRNAQHSARQIIEQAETEARQLKHEAEDFCDQRLAQFEIVLDRTLRTVQAGRARLQVAPLPDGPEGDEERLYDAGEPAFFDQDDT
jgi:cell division septum initiation protein DivIVA